MQILENFRIVPGKNNHGIAWIIQRLLATSNFFY